MKPPLFNNYIYTGAIYKRNDTPTAKARYRARFTFDPNSISIGYSGLHDIFVGRSGTIDVFRVQVTKLYGSYQLRTQARFDSATYTTTAWLPISDAPHLIELDWQAATSAGANNGYLKWWVDEAGQSSFASLDNDTRRVDEARLGPSNGIDTYTRGTEYFDDFESRRSTYIGPVVPTLVASEIHKTYYRAGAQLIAMRVEGDPIAGNNGLFFLHSDHLGSASLTTDANGTTVARQLYDAWGNIRASVSAGKMPTDIGYTGQRLDASTGGLMFYNARYYSPSLNRFISADTMVPDAMNPQAFNRYSYANNNPLRYNDPTGHAYAECLAFAPAGGWVGPAVCVGVEFAVDVILLVSVAQALEQNTELQQRRQQALEQLEPISLEEAASRIIARNPIAGPIARKVAEQYLANSLEDLGGLTTNLLSKKLGKSVDRAGNSNRKTTVTGRIKQAGLPTSGKVRYIPPKGYKPSQPLPKGPNGGYLDKFGNEWYKGPSRTNGEPFEWDVLLSETGKSQLGRFSPDGVHLNVSLIGRVTH